MIIFVICFTCAWISWNGCFLEFNQLAGNMHVNLILMCLIDFFFNIIALYVTLKYDLKNLIVISSWIIAICFGASIFLANNNNIDNN